MAATIFSDNFTGSNSDPLNNRTTALGKWHKHPSSGATMEIRSNRTRESAGATATGFYYVTKVDGSALTSSGDYDNQAKVVALGGGTVAGKIGPAVRVDPSADSGYYAERREDTGLWLIRKARLGTRSTLVSGSFALGTGITRLRVRTVGNPVLTLFDDTGAVLLGPFEDATNPLTAAGAPGLHSGQSVGTTSGLHLDDLNVEVPSDYAGLPSTGLIVLEAGVPATLPGYTAVGTLPTTGGLTVGPYVATYTED